MPATTNVTLTHGLKIGEDTLTEAVLREVTTGDVLEAEAASERLVIVPGEGPALVSSPSAMGVEILRRQIVEVRGGGAPIQGPLSVAQLYKLHPNDFLDLQAAAEKLDHAVVRDLTSRGRDDGAGGHA